MGKYGYGAELSKGKTKNIYRHPLCIVKSRDDITARDDPKFTKQMEGKGAINNRTTCNIFKYLGYKGYETAYVEPYDAESFLARECAMIPLEVVVRAAAYGSFLERFPDVERGMPLSKLKYELYLKTSNKMFRSQRLPVDDPLIEIADEGILKLYDPHKPYVPDNHFGHISISEVIDVPNAEAVLDLICSEACNHFEILAEKFFEHGANLVDFKEEYGVDQTGKVWSADVLTCDEMRLLIGGVHFDKQAFREGKPLEEVKRRYQYVASLTDQFVR